MDSKTRLYNSIIGRDVDYIPLWLREPFFFEKELPSKEHFTSGWMAEPLFADFYGYAKQYSDITLDLGGDLTNRFMMTNQKYIHSDIRQEKCGDQIIHYGEIDLGNEKLPFITKNLKGIETSWMIRPAAEDCRQLEKIINLPFEADMDVAAATYKSYCEKTAENNGGLPVLGVSSPFVCISHCMHLEDALALTVTDRSFVHELLQEITRRIIVQLDALLSAHPMDIVVKFGGSEQCTPPMLGPEGYDEFVSAYDGQIVETIKKYHLPVWCHCHGKVSGALKSMIQIGIDATDPVECPPQGDVTFAQAKQIADDRLTLIGNLEFSELEQESPEYIAERVREIMSFGKKRTILSTSAGPVSAVTKHLMDNYYTMVNTYLKLR